jgi:alanine racemase
LAVSTLQEARELAGLAGGDRLLVMGGLMPSDADLAAELRCAVSVSSVEMIQALQVAAARLGGVALPVHLKVDTGMGRFGCPPEEAVALARLVSAGPNLRLAGVSSHFASADSDPDFTALQLTRFHEVLGQFRSHGLPTGMRHIANSAGALHHPEAALDAVRVGIAMYGCEEGGVVPVLSLRAHIAHLHTAQPGDSVGYGTSWRAEKRTLVATASIGYADGVSRSRAGKGWALVRGRRAPLLGRVSMDAITIDVTKVRNVAVGDTVTLIGADAEQFIRAEEVATWSGTISYEVLTAIGKRVSRVSTD